MVPGPGGRRSRRERGGHAGHADVERLPGAGPGGSGGRRVAPGGRPRGAGDRARRGSGLRGGTAGQVDACAREQRQHQQPAEQKAGAAAERPGATAEAPGAARRAVGWRGVRRGGREGWGARTREAVSGRRLRQRRIGVVPRGTMACGGSGRHVNRPCRRTCRTASGHPLVSRDSKNPCGGDTRGSAPDFREIGGTWPMRPAARSPNASGGGSRGASLRRPGAGWPTSIPVRSAPESSAGATTSTA
jgi:hypothetical protein